MHKIEDFKIESEILKENWNSISKSYVRINKEAELYRNNIKSPNELYGSFFKFLDAADVLMEEWENLYPVFVLEPIKKEVLDFFKKIHLREFDKLNSIEEKIKLYSIAYYIYGTEFYMFVEPDANIYPNLKYDITGRIEISPKSNGLKLEEIFEKIWEHVGLTDFDGTLLYSEGEKNDNQFFQEFLSECWLEAKKITGSNALGFLEEATSACDSYLLDERLNINDYQSFYDNLNFNH
ncbi:hypothetical protein [Winogradskyella endarachnes]|uniref:Uncharacterized protein n=1 Tax=Winogradskyella endarachnes TaxID=2681965 RepID=A0A6L6UCC4_9FLAO|nr:hypothetical protein [Winogradskyella endarachnes]MUU79883.1 hypothetical protein [Winogradskyella endarachnes]